MATPGTVSFPTTLDDIVSLFATANRISTTLNGGISNVDTSVVLTSGTGWPTSGAISFLDTGEIAYYTGKSTNTLTGLIRGQDGTAAAAHSNGVSVQVNDTSRHHQVHSDAIVAIETKLGTGASTSTSGTVLRGTGTGTSAWGAIQGSDLPNPLPAISGVNLTALNATNLGSGTVPLARLSGITNTEISASAAIVDTKLATISTAGKVSDSALSSNIPLKNGTNVITGSDEFRRDNIITTFTNVLLLTNTTASTVGVPVQQSPSQIFTTHAWDTDGPFDVSLDWRITAIGVSTSNPSAKLQWAYRKNAGAFTESMSLDSDQGLLTVQNLTVNSTLSVLTFSAGADIFAGANLECGPTNMIRWNSRSRMFSPSDGVILMENAAQTSFGRVQLGGTTASFPAIKRNAAAIDIRLADDSAYAPLTASNLIATGIITAGSGPTTLTDSVGKILASALNTIDVSHGGTGLATLTAYGIMCAGTTSTGNMQQVSGTGTSGQVLTSNGAAALPTWQNSPAGFTNPMTTRGDIIYRDATNTTTRLGVGAANTVLKTDGTDLAYGQVTNAMLAGSITASKLVGTDIATLGTVTVGTLSTGVILGGVSIVVGSDATGDLHYRNAGGIFTRLAIGATGKILTVVGGLPTWSTPTYPNASGTAGLYLVSDGTNFITKAAPGVVTTLTDGATIATNAALGSRFRVTLGGNRTLSNPTNAVDGQQIVWEIIQDGTGSRTLALDSKFAFGTDITSITLTTTLNKRDFLTAIYNSTADKFYVVGFVKGY